MSNEDSENQNSLSEGPDVARVRAILEARLLGVPQVATRIGRFIVLERVGAGAMGVVFAAFDPQLDRKVAIKLLFEGENDERKRARLLAEAKALARLTHPNVVGVYEIGEHNGRVFITMEYVRGRTLRAWGTERTRNWQETVAVYAQAGAGLAAAHAAGIVHRDFKPDNVLVDQDERARVLDFGLARLAIEDHETPDTADFDASALDDPRMKLTRTGTRVGTPAYMAPEQFSRAAVDQAADQFSFCAALWEALFGERAYPGNTLHELVESITSGRLREPTRGSSVPAWLRSAVTRGLASLPTDRWPSMRDLLDELARHSRRGHTRWLAMSTSLLLFGAVVVGTYAWLEARSERCSGAADQLAGVWDAPRRVEVEAAMIGTGVPHALPSWENTAKVLDAYASEWSDMHRDACSATTIRGEQSTNVMDLRMACLHRAWIGLRATVDVLADADVDVMQNAHEIVGELAPVSYCADVDALQMESDAPDPDEAEMVEHIQTLVAESQSERSAGRYDAARARIEEAAEEAIAIDHEPTKAQTALEEGLVLKEVAEFDAAIAALRRALEHGARSNQRRTTLLATVALMDVLGPRRGMPSEALQLREIAVGLAATTDEQASVHIAVGMALVTQGRYTEGELDVRRGLALLEAEPVRDDLAIADAYASLADVLKEQGRFADWEPEIRETLALRERVLGEAHPKTAIARSALGEFFFRNSMLTEAEQQTQRAMEDLEKALGTDHPDNARPRAVLAAVYSRRAELTKAEEELRHALRLQLASPRGDPLIIAALRGDLSVVLNRQQRYLEAEIEGRQALGTLEQRLGPGSWRVIVRYVNLGTTLIGAARWTEAETALRRGLELAQDAEGPAPIVAHLHHQLGRVLFAGGKYAAAELLFEEALAIWDRDRVPQDVDALAARWLLGVVLLRQHKYERAKSELQRVLAVAQQPLPGQNLDSQVNLSRALLADVELALGNPDTSLALAEQAWVAQGGAVTEAASAVAAFVIARILWQRGSARARARSRELAGSAAVLYEKGDYVDSQERAAEIRRWLDRHRAR